MAKIPFVIVSDGPNEPTGLGRIARDLASQIVGDPVLGPLLDLVHIGGPPIPHFPAWPHVPMGETERGDDWGSSFVAQFYRSKWGTTPGILWVIWDPSRLAAYVGTDLPVQVWSYPAVDGVNRNGGIGGPAGDAISRADRVIAYTRWASQHLRPLRSEPLVYLPHGLTTPLYAPATEEEFGWALSQIGPHKRLKDRIIGCIATNQPRKDLALFCDTLAELQARGHKVYGWLHTDTLVKAWSIPELIAVTNLGRRLTVSTYFDDRELAVMLQTCSVTIAPGLGEGFGYPIVESLASGVPVVHGDDAGGKELVPKIEWRFPVRERRSDGIYAVRRPVFRAEDVANAIERVWRWKEEVGYHVAEAYCRGAVAHLDWASLWGRWRTWIKQGLEG